MLSLLIPFVVYNLTLKAYDIASLPADRGLARVLNLMWSDVFFNLGYALLWIGLFAVAHRGLLRWAVLLLFHAATMLMVAVTTGAHQYFKQTSTTLDYGTIVEFVLKFDELEPILLHDVRRLVWLELAAALLYTTLGPWLVTRAVGWWRGQPARPPARTAETYFLGSLGFWFLAFVFVSLSVLTGTTTLARNPFINLILTGVGEATAEEESNSNAGLVAEHPAEHASLAPTPQTDKRNVVLIHLESTRAQSVTPYNPDLKTTPFLEELAKNSLLAEHAYTIVPRSSKATLAVNCGIEPAPYAGPEFEADGIPVRCLAGLLKEQGYRTVFFQSTSNAANNDWDEDLVRNLGYEEFYPSESMNTEGFQLTNTFGYEDDIMLGPSEEWLRANGDSPFLAQYFTGTGHYAYECVPNRYGSKNFAEEDQTNRYLNCLRYLDFFVENLIDQYKELGLYENTIFVIYGDHGEGFGEHGRVMHGDTPYEEGIRIPLIIHAPGRFENGQREKGLSNESDILPTVLEMLGYEVENGQYPGYSLLHPSPEDRTLFFSCISERKCLASIKGDEKYIYHYGDQPEEVFDLSKDPLEEHNLAGEYSKEALDKRRKDLLAWRSNVNAAYGGG